MSNNIEDLIRDLINDAIQCFADDELDEARRAAYDNTSQVDYRVDNADSEIDDLKNQISDLENRLDSLEQMSDG